MSLQNFEIDNQYENGTILVYGGEKEVSISTIVNDTRVAGIAQNYGVITYGKTACKVVGRLKKGDLITTSNTAGCGIKALNPTIGAIIGKSLEDKDTGEVKLVSIMVGIM